MMSTILTNGYLNTLARNKVGFSRVTQGGDTSFVQGIRGVIERNVMRYHMAIDTFIETHSLPAASRQQHAFARWIEKNERYPEQLHEMVPAEYLDIKRREWANQQQLQQALNQQIQLAAAAP
jgi:hypothetical protein